MIPEDRHVPFLRWITYGFIAAVVGCTIGLFSPAEAASENDHSKAWCQPQGGTTRHTFDDGSKPDCILPDIVVETEWAAPGWKCGPGQAIHYAIQSGQHPAVLLIMDGTKTQKYLDQLNALQKRVFFLTDEGELVRLKIFTMEKLP